MVDSLRIATTLGLISASALGGSQIGISAYFIPAILQSPPSLALEQWRQMFAFGAKIAPTVCIATGATLGFAAYSRYQSNPDDGTWKALAIAAAGTIGMLPFTLVFLQGINSQLVAGKDAATGAKLTDGKVVGLVASWGRMNYLRSLWPLTAAAVGLWGVLS